MITKDNFIHSTYLETGRRAAILKENITGYDEVDGGCMVYLITQACPIITMSYDDIKKELTETIC